VSVCCECYVLSGRGLCDGLIPRPEKPNRKRVRAHVLLCVIRCNNNPLHFQWVGRRGQTKKEKIFWLEKFHLFSEDESDLQVNVHHDKFL